VLCCCYLYFPALAYRTAAKAADPGESVVWSLCSRWLQIGSTLALCLILYFLFTHVARRMLVLRE